MNTEIDWSKAPEDAQYFQGWQWYKIENNRVFTRHPTDENAEWRESAWSVEDDLDNLPDFIKRPVLPLLGLTPKNLWEEQMQHQRRQDIHAAMTRYIEAEKEIPNEWLEELMGLNNILAGIETDFDEEIQSLPVKDDGWIAWGKEEEPDIPCNTVVEKVYSDGAVLKGESDDTYWFGSEGRDGKPYVVIRYRIISEGEQE